MTWRRILFCPESESAMNQHLCDRDYLLSILWLWWGARKRRQIHHSSGDWQEKQPMQANADCKSTSRFLFVQVGVKRVYVTTVYGSQTYRTSRNRSNRMWISKQSNLKGKPRERRDSESGFRAITISRATSLHTRASLDLEILIVGDVFADVFLCSSSKRGLPASKATTINVTSSSSPALYQLPIRTFIFPLSSIFSQNGFSGQGVGEAATTTRSLPNWAPAWK